MEGGRLPQEGEPPVGMRELPRALVHAVERRRTREALKRRTERLQGRRRPLRARREQQDLRARGRFRQGSLAGRDHRIPTHGQRARLDVAVEHSRSGNDDHAWAFFAESVDAALARNLGSALITAAMGETGAIDFKAYDRLFPAQTTVPEGGFGNLISPPFQAQAQRQDNSVFIDEGFKTHPNQWRHLSGIEKIASGPTVETWSRGASPPPPVDNSGNPRLLLRKMLTKTSLLLPPLRR